MTNLEAIKGIIGYPLPETGLTKVLEDRSLTTSGTYVKCASFDLAYADALMIVVASPNINEGGFSVSQSEKDNLISIANGIYAQNGIANKMAKPTAKFVQRW